MQKIWRFWAEFEIPSLGMYAKETQRKWLRENPLYKTYPANVNSLESVYIFTKHRQFKQKLEFNKNIQPM